MLLLDLSERHGPAAVARIEATLDASAMDPGGEPVFRFPGLAAQAWHDPATWNGVAQLEAAAEAIHDELRVVLARREGFQTFAQKRDYFIPPDHWKTMYFMIGGRPVEENRILCPQTARALDACPRLFGTAMFSALLAGGHIAPHQGPSNCRLTVHLGLVVPPGCSIRVGADERSWETGRCLAFDDTFEHEAWNRSDHARFVLYVDIWHPDLTDVEIAFLTKAKELLRLGDDPQHLPRLLREREEQRGHAWW